MIEHFIYDFDGTLSDSYPIFMEIIHELMRRHGGRPTVSEQELYRGVRAFTKYGYLMAEWEAGYTQEAFMKEFQEIQAERYLDFKLFDGAERLLSAVKESGKRNYLYTHTGACIHRILENLGIASYFTDVIDASMGFPSKPAPDALLSLAARHGLDPAVCVMIGDRPIDLEAGKNAGMQSCFFDFDGVFAGVPADYSVTGLAEIINLI